MKKGHSKSEPSIALTKAAFVEQFRKALDNNGVSTEQYFRKFRLPLAEIYDPEALLPEKPFWRLVNQVAIAEMIPDFGMQVAQVKPWHQVASIQPLINKQKNLKILLDTFCEIASSQSSIVNFSTRVDNGTCWFEYSGQPLISNDIQMELYRVTSMIELVQLAAGKNWRPIKVRLMMDRNKVVDKNSILIGCELMFSQAQTAIAFPAGLLNATISPVSDNKASSRSDMNRARRLEEIQDKSELVDALREIFTLYITEEDLSIEVIADIAGLSTRSLQRTMKKHEISYNNLLNEARQQYATTKLGNPEVKISDIAYQLGYNDAAHFTRAFKRWTGMTPSKFRSTQE